MKAQNDKPDNCIVEDKPHKLVKCIACQEKIKNGAIKCTKCGSYQGWRRYFQFNTVVLSLLVALISVLTASATVVQSILTPVSNEKFTFIEYRNNKISIIATNTGKQAAILKEVSLFVQREKDDRKIDLVEITGPRNRQFLLKPNEWIEIELANKHAADDFSLIGLHTYELCQLDFITLNITHEKNIFTTNIPCSQFK